MSQLQAGSLWQKLKAYGVPYTLRFKIWRPMAARVRGAALRQHLVDSDGPLWAHPNVLVERDAGSRIHFGRACHIEASVTLRSIRAHAAASGAEITIGDRCIIKQHSMLLAKSARIRIGSRCAVGRYTEIGCQEADVTIGDNVRIATHVWIGTGNHVYADPDTPIVEQGVEQRPVMIEDDVWIGTHVSILPGVRIGRGTVIAAGAVVTRDVPPLSIVGGVPGRIIKRRQQAS